jgi:GTP cyclohydrolase I
MLPFYGRAHVAYIPDGRVVGISKLARLVDIYARRLQIQERIGEEVTGALMEHLQPKAAACIIEAQHLCMLMRGCTKQNSVMKTSSLRGAFYDKSESRAELMSLLRR